MSGTCSFDYDLVTRNCNRGNRFPTDRRRRRLLLRLFLRGAFFSAFAAFSVGSVTLVAVICRSGLGVRNLHVLAGRQLVFLARLAARHDLRVGVQREVLVALLGLHGQGLGGRIVTSSMVPVAVGAVAFLVVSFGLGLRGLLGLRGGSRRLRLRPDGRLRGLRRAAACANVTELNATTANAAARTVNMRRIGYPPLDLTLGAGRFRRVALQRTKARTRLASAAVVL